jgi:hypothetical protein
MCKNNQEYGIAEKEYIIRKVLPSLLYSKLKTIFFLNYCFNTFKGKVSRDFEVCFLVTLVGNKKHTTKSRETIPLNRFLTA